MAFTSYATAAEVEIYVPTATAGLWGGVSVNLTASLARAAREINEVLGGLDRFADGTLPIAVDDDGLYPEVLIKLNVYVAVFNQVAGTHAGEIFEDHWVWLSRMIRDIYRGIEGGKYRFGSEPDAASSGSQVIELGRASP